MSLCCSRGYSCFWWSCIVVALSPVENHHINQSAAQRRNKEDCRYLNVGSRHRKPTEELSSMGPAINRQQSIYLLYGRMLPVLPLTLIIFYNTSSIQLGAKGWCQEATSVSTQSHDERRRRSKGRFYQKEVARQECGTSINQDACTNEADDIH